MGALHEGCVSYYRNSDYFFYRERYCSFEEDCSLYVSSEAATPSGDTYYVVITSGQNYVNNQDADNTFLFHSDTDYLSVNGYSLKPTSYSLTLNVAPSTSSTGFCSGRTAGNTWAFNNMDLKSSEAQCLYEDMLLECNNANDECKEWLANLACLITMPSVDATFGFIQPVCTEVCWYTEQVCGPFIQTYLDVSLAQYNCYSPRYRVGSSNCLATPTPAPIVDDDDEYASTFSFSLIFVLSSFIFAFLFSLLF